MALLELKNINKYYKLETKETFHVLKDVNVNFYAGELVSIIGESGSGKSTLMNLIGGLDSSFNGELLVDNKNIGDFSEKELDNYRKNKIGFIFQSCNLIPHLSILDNVTIALTLSNVSKEERIEKATKALKEVGLEKHIHKKPNQLSGGQRQRVAIARALINDPEIILADEPTGALDSETTIQVLNIIKDIAKKGRLVIMVTHSDKVAAHSSRVVKIADGKIIEDSGKSVSKDIKATDINKDKISENLSFFSAVKLAGKNMKEKFKRNLLVSIGVSIGIMSLILMLSLGSGLKTYFNDMIGGFMNPLVTEVSMPLEIDSDDPSSAMKAILGQSDPFEEENITELSNIDGVVRVEKGFSITDLSGTNTVSLNDNTSTIMQLKSASSVLTDDNIEDGELPGANEILVNSSVAEKLGEDVIGKTVELTISNDGQVVTGSFVISGIYKPLVESEMSSSNEIVYANFDDVEEMFNEIGVDFSATTLYLVADNESDSAKVKEAAEDLGYSGSTEEIMGKQMLTMLDVLTIVLSGIAAISLLVSSIMILVVLNISVVERTKEIGLLRSIGARSKDIKRIFVSEAFLIGLSSGIIGLTVSYVASLVVNSLSMQNFDMEVMNLTATYALSGVLLSTVISMLAGLLPANKASKLDPVDSLRSE